MQFWLLANSEIKVKPPEIPKFAFQRISQITLLLRLNTLPFFMKKELDLVFPPEIAFDEAQLEKEIIEASGVDAEDVKFLHKVKRSIDARGRKVNVKVRADIYTETPPVDALIPDFHYPEVSNKEKVVIVGAGPAGLFAALRCIELGLKPVVL